MDIRRILGDAVKTGTVLALTTTGSILLASRVENGAPWAALNAVAHIVDGDEKEQPTQFSPRESGLGLAVNAAAMMAWGVLYEGALAVMKARPNLLTGTVGAAKAYVIDYYLVPKRLTPGIEKRLSGRGIFAAYAALGLTLALSSRWNAYAHD